MIVLDNGTTAMTGQQEHAGTGRLLDHNPTNKLSIEAVAAAVGIESVTVIDPYADPDGFEQLLRDRLASTELSVIVARRPCLLATGRLRKRARAAKEPGATPEPASAGGEGGTPSAGV